MTERPGLGRCWYIVMLPVFLAGLFALTPSGHSQTNTYERTFPESPGKVESTLKSMQSSAGRLPTLDGFAVPGSHGLERYQRGYYQCTVHVTPAPSGGSRVQVNVKITAWYADADPSKSGYQLLASNGRIESDLLDRLADELVSKAATPEPIPSTVESVTPAVGSTPPAKPKTQSHSSAPTISAPMPGDGVRSGSVAESNNSGSSSPFKLGTPGSNDQVATLETRKAVTDKHVEELTQQAQNLEEILKNQAHPTNLVAVKKANTPVLAGPSEGAKVLFLASAEDEFEILDSNSNWVHVRISGLSRGWIRRSNLDIPSSPATAATSKAEVSEKPEASVPAAGVPQKPAATAPAAEVPQIAAASAPEADAPPFQVENEQIASFPGTWEPLRGKTVKIIAVQKGAQGSVNSGSHDKLEFAKSILDREYAELTQTKSTVAGVVLIFDSEDGGMLAATLPVLHLWKGGVFSDEAFWGRCYFDPPRYVQFAGQ